MRVIDSAVRLDPGYSARQPSPSTTKSDASLFETPQSITIVTREQLDARQAQTLDEALRGVAGVVSNNFGRRGWDDIVIRGQRASESVYVDGLKLEQSSWVAQELFGVERVEVLKGPASINFGLVQPGGLVNMVSKRPRPVAFGEAGVTVGSDGLRQGTLDLGRPLSESGKAAFRITALAKNSDDPTDFVFFKNRYVAPSLSLDFGPRTEFVLLGSFQQRNYLRQQGLPITGTLRRNVNGRVPLNRFMGEPGFGPYDAEQARLGYSLSHAFASGWTLRQNFRWQELEVDGRAVFLSALQDNQRLQNRSATLQDVRGRALALDTHALRTLDAGGLRHHLMVGVDLNHDRNRSASTTCAVPALDVFDPVYGAPITCPPAPRSDTTSTVKFVGVYARDRIEIGQRWSVLLGARHDRIDNEAFNHITGLSQSQDDRSTTGNAALQFELTPWAAPYVSHATSFLPVSGVDAGGAQFQPEKGRQTEAGVKLQGAGGRLNAALAVYHLTRTNVLTADPNNDGFSVQTGEQRSKGFEAEVAADLSSGWSVAAAYTYTDAKLTRDNSANVGKVLNNVPRHSASLWSTHRFEQGALADWSVSWGLRHESAKSGFTVNYEVPGYTVADLGVAYQGAGWRVGANVNNLFDREYFAGVLNNNVVPVGTPRQLRVNAVMEF
ncbi:TonB-dependent siderophore receptor [Methylibium sp.]|uniref:TonB-dependent siderophore receptor n=1 Tax=Methylibium sp. TaxID=2067992 RepID=UPI0017AFA15B|nr:TonB-dependent siderophore receptor [Methylibium sp.]MBA3590393.1 TonB-dependent siderophore receptor [Methylibium sp.]